MNLDGDFKSNKGDCPYHCSPTCHPMQTGGLSGTEWFYGCTHEAWPSNREGDFVPIVDCGGYRSKCDMQGKKFVAHFARGLKVRKANSERKASECLSKLAELTKLTGYIS